MPQEVLKHVLQGSTPEDDLYNWLISDSTANDSCIPRNVVVNCSQSEFISFFLNFLRNETNRYLNVTTNNQQIKDGNVESSSNERSNMTGSIQITHVAHTDLPANETELNQRETFIPKSHNAESTFVAEAISPVHYSRQMKADYSAAALHSSTPTNVSLCNKSSNKFQKSGERISLSLGDYVQTNSVKKKHNFGNRSKQMNSSVSDCQSNATCSTDSNTNSMKYFNNEITPDRSIMDQEFPLLGSSSKNVMQRHYSQSSKRNQSRRIKPTSLNFNDTHNETNERKLNKPFNKTSLSFNEGHDVSDTKFEVERNILKNEKDLIKKQFANIKHINPVYIQPKENTNDLKSLKTGDISNVTYKKELNSLINLYSMILDNNLIANFINEISFIFSLLNAEEYQTDNLMSEKSIFISEFGIDLFESIHNCIYFCTHTLQKQRQFLILLDSDTVKVLRDNIRVQGFNPSLHNYLTVALEQKKGEPSYMDGNSIYKNNVCFQSDTDNRENFTSDQTFRVFRKQRDIFYDMLRNWENCHHRANFQFTIYDTSIMNLFNMNNAINPAKSTQIRRNNDTVSNEKHMNMRTEFGRINVFYNNVCNMAHFARLFIKQLLASCENEHRECSQLVLESLPNVDPNRLSRLSSRFVTNSSMTNDTTSFTGIQEFFKNFIVHSDNYIFTEHLKLEMCHEILDTNAACLEYHANDIMENVILSNEITINHKPQEGANIEDKFQQDFDLVKKVSSLRLLAKYLGFVTDLPYNNNGNKMKSPVIKNLDKLKIQPLLDLNLILSTSNDLFGLFVVVQWITMYLSMLNESTLTTEYYKSLIEKLFEIYTHNFTQITSKDPNIYFKYCVKTILGQFFDLPNIAANFNDWRFSNTFNRKRLKKEVIQHVNEEHVDENTALIPLRIKILETMLYQNVPILNSLRSVIKGFEIFNKSRVRHVTPFTDQSSIQEIEIRRVQSQLEAHFFNNQPSSVRKTVDFIIDRTYSAIVKQIIAKDIAEAKAIISQKIAMITSSVKNEVEMRLLSLCTETLKELRHQCNSSAEVICDERIRMAMDCLFPIEMLESVKNMCTKICNRKVKLKYQTWIKDNVSDIKILCKDIECQADQIISKNISKPHQIILANTSNINKSLSLNDDHDSAPGPSEVLVDLQDLLCNIITKQYEEDALKMGINEMFDKIECCTRAWVTLFNIFLKTLLSLTVDITIALVCHYPNCATQVSARIMNTWRMDIFNTYTVQYIEKDDREEKDNIDDTIDRVENANFNNIQNTDENFIFSKLMSPRSIIMLSNCSDIQKSWSAFADLLCSLFVENFLSLDYFCQKSSQLLRTEWSNETLRHLSNCIRTIMKKLQSEREIECSEITLLLEWMAEFCEDIDIL